MDLHLHRYEFLLTNRGIKGLLHLLFDGDFAFPKENLTLSLNNFAENVGFLLLKLSNLVFELDRLVFELL